MDTDQNNEVALLTKLLQQHYNEFGVKLHRLAQGAKNVYRAERINAPDWVLRDYRLRNAELDSCCPAIALATRLLFLEQKHYPTEYVIRAGDGSAVIAQNDLRLLVTSYLGESIHLWQQAAGNQRGNATGFDYDPGILRALGGMLGRLHTWKLTRPIPLFRSRACSPAQNLPRRPSV